MDSLLAQFPAATLAQASYSLVSWIKPLLFFATLLPYLWVCTKIEKDARQYLLPVTAWNGALLAGAVVAVAAVLLIPIFWIGWPVMILVLAGSLWAYWQFRDRRVPAHAKFDLFSADLGKKLEARRAKKAMAEAALRFRSPDRKPFAAPQRESPEYAAYMQVEELIVPALDHRASRLDVVPAPSNQAVVPTQVIDGVRYKREAMPPNVANEIIDYIKKIGGLDLQDRRRRQSAEIAIEGPTGDVTANLTVWGSNAGQFLRMDFDRAKRLSVPFDALGLLPTQREFLATLAEPANRHGVVLVASAPGQGLTTSAYSLLSRHDAYTCNIKTLEKQIDLHLEGVDHQQFNPANPNVDFATALQSILRRDPDIVYVADITDPNAGKIASTPGLSGPLIYVGIPADSIAGALTEWVRAVGDLRQAAKPLVAIIHQRLIRKVCEACRQPQPATPELLKRLGVPQGKQITLFRQSGKVQEKNRVVDCPVCQGAGFFGLTACFEVMPIDDQARSLIAGNDFKGAYAHARREGRMLFIQESGMAKVRDGVTSLDELVRVFPPAKAPPAAAASARS